MKPKNLEKWEKIRAAGKRKFILKYGGLILGLIGIGIVGQIFMITINFITNDFNFSFFDKSFQFTLISRLVSAFPIGCLWGWIMWKITEQSYLKAILKSK